jgi:hypothetical protein
MGKRDIKRMANESLTALTFTLQRREMHIQSVPTISGLMLILTTLTISSPPTLAQTSANSQQDQIEKCVTNKVALFRKQMGEGPLIRFDMLEEWRGECTGELARKSKPSQTNKTPPASNLAQNQWTYIGTYTQAKWLIDTASIKYENPTIISFEIKSATSTHFHMKLNCANRTMSQLYEPYQPVPNTNNVVTALMGRLCFPMN